MAGRRGAAPVAASGGQGHTPIVERTPSADDRGQGWALGQPERNPGPGHLAVTLVTPTLLVALVVRTPATGLPRGAWHA